MFWNYLVTASRNLLRHKLHSFISIAGLSVGLTCATLIILFLRDELSYDRWISDSANLYRAEVTFNSPGRSPLKSTQAPFPLPIAMQEEIPEVRAMTHVVPERMTATIADRQFPETVTVVDPNFFQVIKLPLVQGNPAQVLTQPESIVLSQRVARKYFGDADPLGKTVWLAGAEGYACDRNDAACLAAVHPLTVTGVLRDLPHNTQLIADLIIPNSSQADEISPSWRRQAWTSTDGCYAYIALLPGTDPQTVLAKLAPILDRAVNPRTFGLNLRGSEAEQFSLTRFWDVHLTSDQYGGMQPPGSWSTVYGFAIIALLIVLVACFNFMNLATARATLRAQEISLRKTVGAKRHQLVLQFLVEALVTAAVSLVVALALVDVLLPLYDGFLSRPIDFHYLTDWRLSLALVAGAVVAGLLSGAYPALVLSAFRPAVAAKMSATAQTGSGSIRTVLIVFQFAVSIGLGIATIVVFSQLHFARNIDLGFDRDGVIVIRGIRKLTPSALESFSRTLLTSPQVAAVAASNAVPFDLFNSSNYIVQLEGETPKFAAHIVNMGTEFPSLYGMRLLTGRLLGARYGEDELGHNVLINAQMVRRTGHTAQEVIGKTIDMGKDRPKIVGVLADAKLDGMKESVVPTLYRVTHERLTLLSVRVHGGRIADALTHIDKTWRSFAPSVAIQPYFLSDAFDKLFAADEKQGTMFGLFVSIAIFIACLGLFGLAVFTAQRRTKEIGVRKIFGASTADLVRLLLRQISVPVLVANAIAWPIAYYYLRHWLDGYAYRISLNPLYFLTAGVVALAIAWATVFAHAVRLARADPIHALRYE